MKPTIRIATLCLTIIAAVGSSTAWAVVCPNYNTRLTTQAQVDELGGLACTQISGQLTIAGGADIISLDALSAINTVGSMYIINNSALGDL